MSKPMIFVPPGNEAVQIGLTSGHTAVVEPEGTELSPIYHAQAIALGCMPKGIEPYQAPKNTEPTRADLIRGALLQMLDSSDDGLFTETGRPVLKMVSKFAGFGCSREEVDAIWNEIKPATTPDADGSDGDGQAG